MKEILTILAGFASIITVGTLAVTLNDRIEAWLARNAHHRA